MLITKGQYIFPETEGAYVLLEVECDGKRADMYVAVTETEDKVTFHLPLVHPSDETRVVLFDIDLAHDLKRELNRRFYDIKAISINEMPVRTAKKAAKR